MDVFFFNDTATTEIYTLSLHDALPIWEEEGEMVWGDEGCNKGGSEGSGVGEGERGSEGGGHPQSCKATEKKLTWVTSFNRWPVIIN